MVETVVGVLRQLLAQAENGEFVAVAVATVETGLTTGCAYSLGAGTVAELLGSVVLLQHRLVTNAKTGEH